MWAFDYKRLCDERDALNALLKAPRSKKRDTDEGEGRWYFMTITQPDVNKDLMRMKLVTEKIIASKQTEPIEWAYCLELTKSGTPHSHIRLKSPHYVNNSKIQKLNDNYITECVLEKRGCYNYVSDFKKAHPPGQWFYCSDNYSGPKPEDPGS